MVDAPKALEQALTRMAQKARAAGVHIIMATLRASATALSGSIKANFPGRIALKVTDNAESKLILAVGGPRISWGPVTCSTNHPRRTVCCGCKEAMSQRQNWPG